MLNKVQLIGHLGADPDIRRMTNGNPVANLRLATSDRWKDKATGERRERTEWHRITIYNENVVRIVEQYTRKGSKLYVEGALRTRKYTDQGGAERYATEIVIENFNGGVTLLDSAERSQHGPEDYGTTRSRDDDSGSRQDGSERRSGGGSKPNYDLDDDIPF